MQRITEIRLRNYRAFGDREEVISLPKGENLLVYGENGSGKSSLYWALRDVLASSVNSKLSFARNRFLPKLDPGYLHLTLTDDPHQDVAGSTATYIFHSEAARSTTTGVPALELAYKQQGFLTYKEIVASYLTDLNAKRPNLYSFVVDDLLAHHLLPNAGQPISEVWKVIADRLKKGPGAARDGLWNVEVPQFTRNLGQLLTRIVTTAQKWLTTYFGPTTELAGAYVNIIRRGNSLKEYERRLEVDIRFYSSDLEKYHDTLNEARLSALAVCLYLAALKEYPDALEFKPLVLDDIFVGLDTNNRLPLLNLLHTEFVSKHYQVVLTTYDREWYALAANWFKQWPSTYGWRQLEMYEEETENVPGTPPPVVPFRPALVPFKDSYEKAKTYFQAQDYPAAGNYLRKALEEATKKLAPFESGDPDADARDKNNSVDARFGRLKELRKACGEPLSDNLLAKILLYQKLVLHPSSHYNTTHALYRDELKTTFQLVDELRKEKVYRVVRLLAAGETLRYEASDPATFGYYWSECQLDDDLCIVVADGKFVEFSPCSTRTLRWEWNGVPAAKDKDGGVYDSAAVANICAKQRKLTERASVIEFTLKPHVTGVDVLRDFKLAAQPVSLNELLANRQKGFPASAQEA